MKNTVANASSSATLVLKQIVTLLRTMAKAKSTAIRSKTQAIRARLEIFSLLRNKKPSLLQLSRKIHSLLPGGSGGGQGDNINPSHNESSSSSNHQLQLMQVSSPHHNQAFDQDCDEDPYPDLTHSLFNEADAYDQELDRVFEGDPDASVIDLVKNSKEQDGENFSLEAEIDHVADLFILKFHKKMRMQKLESFKRYQEMLERSA